MDTKNIISHGGAGLSLVLFAAVGRLYVSGSQSSRHGLDAIDAMSRAPDVELTVNGLSLVLLLVGTIVSIMGIAKYNSGRGAGIVGTILAAPFLLPIIFRTVVRMLW